MEGVTPANGNQLRPARSSAGSGPLSPLAPPDGVAAASGYPTGCRHSRHPLPTHHPFWLVGFWKLFEENRQIFNVSPSLRSGDFFFINMRRPGWTPVFVLAASRRCLEHRFALTCIPGASTGQKISEGLAPSANILERTVSTVRCILIGSCERISQ